MTATEVPLAASEKRSTGGSAPGIVLGLVLLIPAGLFWISGLVVPTVKTVVASLQESSFFGEAQFVGLENYARLFHSPQFPTALSFTLLLVVVRVLVVAVAPLLLALAVNEFGRAVRIPIRLLFTIPLALFAPVAVALTWAMALHPHFGLVNAILPGLGLPSPQWLMDPKTARVAFLLVDSFTTFGLACGVGLVFYLTALRGPGEDAPSWKKVLVPLIASWVTGLLATIALTLQSFTMSYTLTGGGPVARTTTLMLYQHEAAFQLMRFGSGAAVSTLVLVVVTLLGLIAGLIVVLTGLRLEKVSWEKQSGLLTRDGKRKAIAIVLLATTLLVSLGCCLPSALPWPWSVLNSFKNQAEALTSPPSLFPSSPSLEAYATLVEEVPMGRVLVNTISPILGVLLIQIPVVYLGALGIGAMRPFKKRSELLLLPFSPWLFVTVGPLSIAAFEKLRTAGLVNTTAGLASPIVLSVPALFILTLFFKGQEPGWRMALAEGQSPVKALFIKLILPSLPLVALLACASFLAGLHDLLWPLIAGAGRESLTANVVLLYLRNSPTLSWSMLAAAVTLFGLPAFLFFFLIFGLLQALFLDRLALVTHSPGDEDDMDGGQVQDGE